MKRRDFLKLSAGSVIFGTIVAQQPTTAAHEHEAVSPPVDWSVKFNAMTAQITQNTYDAFFNDTQQHQKSPDAFLNYLFSSVIMPRCEKVDGMELRSSNGIVEVTFTGVVFSSNTRQHPMDFFAGYEHAQFCLSSPDSKSGTHVAFSEQAL